MNSWAGRSGAALISWPQTIIDGQRSALPETLCKGAVWRWTGNVVDLDPAETYLPEGAFSDLEAHRRHSVAVTCRVIGRALGYALSGVDANRTFTVTDGCSRWIVTLIDLPGRSEPVLMFSGRRPPANRDLRVVSASLAMPLVAAKPAGVVCFTPGTRIETPGGPRCVEQLAAGDRIVTADAGAREIIWIGARHIGSRELRDTPDVAPIRIRKGAFGNRRSDGDLIVSPDHAMLLHGRGGSEVLVAARDLADGRHVLREPAVGTLDYVHLMLEQHHIIFANGFETESFHPESAHLDAVPELDRLRLLDVMPALKVGTQAYGPPARPVLSGAEAALVATV